MEMNNDKPPLSGRNKKFLYRYASLGTQILVGLGLAVFIGLKLDRWLHTLPLFSCVLPLLVLGVMFYKLFKETSNTKKDEKK
jgi:F0F1-type ATP synthase assembly protein I